MLKSKQDKFEAEHHSSLHEAKARFIGGLDPLALLAGGIENQNSGFSHKSWTPPSIEELDPLIHNITIQELIGRVGMGAVYKVWKIELERVAAMKILPLEMISEPILGERFLREARSMANLHHPNIVTIYDFGWSKEGHLYYLMEYIDGENLAQLIKKEQMNLDTIVEIISKVCHAIDHAHKLGYIHRDIKSANILIGTSGQVKITDFGLTKILNQSNPTEYSRKGNMGLGIHRQET